MGCPISRTMTTIEECSTCSVMKWQPAGGYDADGNVLCTTQLGYPVFGTIFDKLSKHRAASQMARKQIKLSGFSSSISGLLRVRRLQSV
jgi:hypothetical protein